MRFLCLRAGLDLDNEGIKAIISACPNLRVANFKVYISPVVALAHCFHLVSHLHTQQCASNLDPALLATIPLHCPDLEVLRLYGNSVDKDLFTNISTNCTRLHTLDLRRLNVPFDDVKVIGDSSRYVNALPSLVPPSIGLEHTRAYTIMLT
jgi:hypothetical protein